MNKLGLYPAFFSLMFFYTINAIAQTNLTGNWTWHNKTSSLELNLYQNGNNITGTYCAITQNGNRIDCSDTEPGKCLISGKLIGNTAKIAFASCYSNMIDTATISYHPNKKTLKWEWTQTTPDIYAPVPVQAILTRTSFEVAPMPDLLKTTQSIVEVLKGRNFSALINYFHPIEGVRFSPYAYVDTLTDQILSSSTFTKALKQGKTIIWGAYEGNAEPLELDIKTYFDKFVYNTDFSYPNKKSINKEIGTSTTVSNLPAIYPGADFIEYYIQTIDENNEVSNWKSLRLVLKEYKNQYYLIGVVHDGVN